MKRLIVLACLLFFVTSCASIFNGKKAQITVDNVEPISDPVVVRVDGVPYTDVYLPAKVRVKRGYKPTTITANAEGYTEGQAVVKKKFNSLSLLNVFNPLAWGVDAATGATSVVENSINYGSFITAIINFIIITRNRTYNLPLFYQQVNIMSLFFYLFITLQNIIRFSIQSFSHFIKTLIIYSHIFLKKLFIKRLTRNAALFMYSIIIAHFIRNFFHHFVLSMNSNFSNFSTKLRFVTG